ncbi:MAG: hypothetical protein DRQ49_09660 [Gammaproteobacteria bacterium]|nr:MAG: hypothetical protein DRQ49_09660 [Gammaproteobacteria bacterium]RKZ43029.1 MAG: hypothetical protein DRQ41_06310 [Gammaproteobacteria bacterium]RKZ76995.1 MAG: hypothetical protein DRQ57_01870 [Gammaproteobacteria bacterium]
MKTNIQYPFQKIHLDSKPGIADKTPFSEIMCESFEVNKYRRLLDVGCGSGIIGIYALLNRIPFVYFNDIQHDAVELAQRNLNRYLIEKERYRLIEGSFEQLDLLANQVDAITFNPPQLPTDLVDINSFQEESERIFRDGGKNGRKLIDNFFIWVSGQQLDNITIYLGVSSLLKIDSLLEEVQQKYNLAVIKKHKKTVLLRKLFYPHVAKMSAIELHEREIELIDGSYYKKIYVLQFEQKC